MKQFLEGLYGAAVQHNKKNIQSMLEKNQNAHFLDLGCDDGVLTKEMANRIATKNVHGVEIVDERIAIAEKNQVQVKKFDLNGKFNFEDDQFDAIHSNQVIEHVNDSDTFISELFRVLKNGGYAVISTENASSWCNIFASILGWQIFSLTNFSNKKQGIGNPFALHRGDNAGLSSWNHVRIYNIRGLKEYFEAFGFTVEEIRGAGYFPLPTFFATIDKTHSHFISYKVRKS